MGLVWLVEMLGGGDGSLPEGFGWGRGLTRG